MHSVVLGIVQKKHEGGEQRGTLTARYAIFSVQCSIQYTVQVYSAVFDKIYACGVSMHLLGCN